MVGRIARYRYPPAILGDVIEDVFVALRGNRSGYDRRLQAGFLFSDHATGEVVVLTVATDEQGLRLPPAEPEGTPEEIREYRVVKAAASTPREGVAMFADFVAGSRLPELGDRVRATFLLEHEPSRSVLSVVLTEDVRPHEMQYLFLRDPLVS